MFIERSSARIRGVRTLFVLLGVLPCAALCGWAVAIHSPGHREAIAGRAARVLGLSVRLDRVEHVRPDVLRLWGCTLASPAGVAVLDVPVVEVESSPTEVRVRLEKVACTPHLARVLADLARQWLLQPARFPPNVVVDVGDFRWATGRGHDGRERGAELPATRFRVECVAANGGRAIRVSRQATSGTDAGDEFRLVVPALQDADGTTALTGVAIELTGTVDAPIPVAILEACAGLDARASCFGSAAVAAGRMTATWNGGRWSGSAAGRVDGVDLSEMSAGAAYRISGEAAVLVDTLEWRDGRIAGCEAEVSAIDGTADQRLLDALVSALGCRPGAAYRSTVDSRTRGFGQAAARLRIGPAGVELRAPAGRGSVLVSGRDGTILEQPAGAVPLERLAWVLSPPTASPVPASPGTAWLLRLFAEDLLEGRAPKGISGKTAAEHAIGPVRRSDF